MKYFDFAILGTGWIQNTNSNPFTAAVSLAPKSRLSKIQAPDSGEFPCTSCREVLKRQKKSYFDSFITMAYGSLLACIWVLIPMLLKAYDERESARPLSWPSRSSIQNWDYRTSKESGGHVFGAFFFGMNFYAKSENIKLSDSFNATFGKVPNPSALVILATFSQDYRSDECHFGNWNNMGEIQPIPAIDWSDLI